MSEPINPEPGYWGNQILLILIAIGIFIVVKGVLSCGSM